MRELVIFGRPGCHLCEEVFELLEPLCRARDARVRVADVDLKPEWKQQFGDRVPVVFGGDRELSGYPADTATIIAWLDHAGM